MRCETSCLEARRHARGSPAPPTLSDDAFDLNAPLHPLIGEAEGGGGALEEEGEGGGGRMAPPEPLVEFKSSRRFESTIEEDDEEEDEEDRRDKRQVAKAPRARFRTPSASARICGS